MNYWEAILLGVVEGLSEFLPVSSTGHLILISRIFGIESSGFVKSFQIAIQLGAILSVGVLYWRSFFIRWDELKRVMCGFIPTGLVGFLLYKIIKDYFFEDIGLVVGALFFGGLVIVALEWRLGRSKKEEKKICGISRISYRKAFLIGLCQALAVIPGVSRSAATIMEGLLLGIGRKTMVEFSFLLALPTMLSATGLDLVRSSGDFSGEEFGLLAIGFLTSFGVAALCVRWFLKFIQKHDFTAFGVYRMILAPVFWFLMR